MYIVDFVCLFHMQLAAGVADSNDDGMCNYRNYPQMYTQHTHTQITCTTQHLRVHVDTHILWSSTALILYRRTVLCFQNCWQCSYVYCILKHSSSQPVFTLFIASSNYEYLQGFPPPLSLSLSLSRAHSLHSLCIEHVKQRPCPTVSNLIAQKNRERVCTMLWMQLHWNIAGVHRLPYMGIRYKDVEGWVCTTETFRLSLYFEPDYIPAN